MPDEQDAEFDSCAGGKETEGEDVGGEQEKDGREQRENRGAIDHESRDGRDRSGVHCCD